MDILPILTKKKGRVNYWSQIFAIPIFSSSFQQVLLFCLDFYLI